LVPRNKTENESEEWSANLVCKSQAHIPNEQRQSTIGHFPGETERVEKEPGRFESEGPNIGTFGDGHILLHELVSRTPLGRIFHQRRRCSRAGDKERHAGDEERLRVQEHTSCVGYMGAP
jgi:hypothetical protein